MLILIGQGKTDFQGKPMFFKQYMDDGMMMKLYT